MKPAYVALNSAIATSRKAPTGGVCATVAEPKQNLYVFSLCGFFALLHVVLTKSRLVLRIECNRWQQTLTKLRYNTIR